MLFFYNSLQLVVLLLFLPVLGAVVACKPKYRRRIPKRLGWGLRTLLPMRRPGTKIVWVHALSVGEVTSALPLVAALGKMPEVTVVFSATTEAGARTAVSLIAPHVERILPFPLDILPVVERFLRLVRPDVFILVETDFWPNLLAALQRNGIPAILVNGRISQKSMTSYRRFGLFFGPLFRSFAALSMQTAADRDTMIALGVPKSRVHTLGNLKFDTAFGRVESIPAVGTSSRWNIVAGSTHRGEEELLLRAAARLRAQQPDLTLVIAPRDVSRGREIQQAAKSLGLAAVCRSQGLPASSPQLLILDCIGELAGYYRTCEVAFVGGSLVEQGGHNPLEPALCGVPVLFGPHMEDFAEIAAELLAGGGALRVDGADSLLQTLERLLADPELRRKIGGAGLEYIAKKRGVVSRHLELIREFL